MAPSPNPPILTVDVEDWYQVENLRPVAPPETWSRLESRLDANVERLLDLFDARDVRATFFVLGSAARRCPDVVRAIVDRGHEVASHGWSHELIYRQTPEVFREETRRAKALLEDLSQGPILGYRASTFSITQRSLWALEILAEEGFLYDSSIAPVRHDRYGIPEAPPDPHLRTLREGREIAEFPVAVMRVLGWRVPIGGGFFRLFPLRWTAAALARSAEEGRQGMLYLHPWEIDPSQPRLPGLGLLRHVRHYLGLARTERKLDGLLRSFRFTTMRDALARTFPSLAARAPVDGS